MLIDFRQLWPKYGIKPTGVLHVGANVGEEAPVYLEMGVKRQVWIEANPEIYKTLKQNIADNPRAEAWNYCVGDDEGKPVNLHISNNAGQSSSVLDLGTHAAVHPDVHYIRDYPTTIKRLEYLFHDYPMHFSGLDFLNIDVQGFELNVLRGLGEYLNQFKWAYLEVNDQELYKGCALYPEVVKYMTAFNFNVAERKMAGNTGWGDALYIKG